MSMIFDATVDTFPLEDYCQGMADFLDVQRSQVQCSVAPASVEVTYEVTVQGTVAEGQAVAALNTLSTPEAAEQLFVAEFVPEESQV